MAILVFEHSDLSGSDRLGETLRDYGHRLNVVRVHRGEAIPADLSDVDGIVTCGGPHEPTTTEAWVDQELELIRLAHARELPVLGICLGSQLVARALGGEVAKMEAGIEFGFKQVTMTATGREDPILTGIAWQSMQFEYHEWEVTELPAGARLLASSEQCSAQAWTCGVRTYGIQYHPEIRRERITEWIDDEPDLLSRAGLTQDTVDRQIEEHFDHFERLATRLFESIALCLMPVDRRHAGLIKDLHH